MYNILIVKYGEIGVKGKNRYIFEQTYKNVKYIKPMESLMYIKNMEEYTLI